ncbi:universal stress protein [Dyadobacter bucti]|uniref:universal stress protein n=1 Tax=Dyadobacter bucti TaxID=2572203 RepID=UPI003F730745
MKTILIPVDFSENAEKAIAAAKIIAAETGSKLLLMYVYQPYVTDIAITEPISSLPIYEQLEDSYRKQLDKYVADAIAEGFDADSAWKSDGIHAAIISQAKESKADLIVMGRTGKGGFLDKLIGSSATGVALDAPCPVLIVPPQSSIQKFKKIIYATQLEYEENDLILQAIGFGKRLGARITFLKVNSRTQPDIQSDEQYINEITAELDILTSDIVIRDSNGILSGIEDYCDEVQADLLIVSSRHRSFLEEYLINPSLTRKLVVRTHLPLLVYHLRED